ncbi:terpenoid synthase [Aspergillus campestris IBT 28561]|uniref:Terpenoid synthase n=1 Tax=Aspergillus campestris (strain IBT 28561) TaxID=1392248 RepID=A0A2I1CTY8_ASPC2|nr:terpenoid synthase [Aspergillus campestris IBT 28561]PKY01088.1 terpenoid synthase [Aspergillus campestris IBT 28561]
MADRRNFEAVKAQLVDDLNIDLVRRGTPKEHVDRILKCLTVNIAGGKYLRGLCVIETGLMILQRPLTDTEFHELGMLGWMAEILHASFLILDDILDDSDVRRGQPCWYKREGIGLSGSLDSILLRSSIFILLKQHFQSHPAYCDMHELLSETCFQTDLGQIVDTAAGNGHIALDVMDKELLSFVAAHKSSAYTFCLPALLALHYLHRASAGNLAQAQNLLMRIGNYYQAQDDFLDVFGNPAVTGKIGTDIQDNKCTWVLVQAMRSANPAHQEVLRSSYGRKSAIDETRVRQIFAGLDIKGRYLQFEDRTLREIQEQIENLDESEG